MLLYKIKHICLWPEGIIYEGKFHKKVPYFWNFNLFIKIPLRTQPYIIYFIFLYYIPAIENQELQNNGNTQLQFHYLF